MKPNFFMRLSAEFFYRSLTATGPSKRFLKAAGVFTLAIYRYHSRKET